jgi:hypothetical protein
MLLRTLFVLFVTGAAFAQPGSYSRTSNYTFPLVAVAVGSEGIEVNLINLASNPTNGNPASCTGSVAFSTVSQGTVISGTTDFTLAAGAATSIMPTAGNNIATTPPNRVLLKVVVTSTNTSGVPCSLAYTLNTFDSTTGATHVFLVGASPATIVPLTNPGR